MANLTLMATNIKNELAAVTGIKEAFDHEPQSMNRLPAATLYFDGFSQSDRTTKRKSLDWRWIIRIYVPIRTSDIKVPQIEIRDLIQGTIEKFRTNHTLGGVCLYHTINNGDVSALLEQNHPMMVAELMLVATTEEG